MLLAIDIGNSNVVIGCLNEEDETAFTTSALYAAVNNMVHNQAVAYNKL